MPINDINPITNPFPGNGSNTAFPFTFTAYFTSDLLVTKEDSSGNITTLVLDSDYVVTLNTDQANMPGGTVSYPVSGSPLPAGSFVTVESNQPVSQGLNLVNGGAFNAANVTQALDKLTIIDQQNRLVTDCSIKIPAQEYGAFTTLLPSAAQRANLFVAFDSLGNTTVAAGGSQGPPGPQGPQGPPGQNGTGSGTVTSVGLSLPALFTVSGSPITSAGTLSATLATQAAHQVFIGPASSSAAPTFRALAIADLPASGVTAASYTNASLTVNAQGLITAASNGAGGAGGAIGSTTKLAMLAASANTSQTFTADQVVVGTALNGSSQVLPSFSQTVNLASTGAGGMDAGAAPLNGFVSIYAIAQANGTQNILACAEATSNGTTYSGANMPAGYSFSALIGIWPTNGSRAFPIGCQLNRRVRFAPINVLSTSSPASTPTSLSLSSAVPVGAKAYGGYTGTTSTASGSCIGLSPDSAGVILTQIVMTSWGNTLNGYAMDTPFYDIPIMTAQTTYYYGFGGGVSTNLVVNQYEF